MGLNRLRTSTNTALNVGSINANNSTGNTGQYLESTGTGTRWSSLTSPTIGGNATFTGNVFLTSSAYVAGNFGVGTSNLTNRLNVSIATTDSVSGSVLNSYPIASFINSSTGGGNRGLEIGAPTGGIASPVYLKISGTSSRFAVLNASNSEQFTISNSGNIGVGTDSPSARLSIGSGSLIDANVPVQISTQSASGIAYYGANNNGSYGALFGYDRNSYSGGVIRVVGATDTIDFVVNNSTLAARFDSSGNLGVGRTNPTEKLHVVGNTASTTLSIGARALSSSYNCWSETGSGAMGIIGHNARSGTNANTVISNNNGWHGHFIRMYYSDGIAFHTTTGTVSAGSTLYDQATPSNQVASAGERFRLAPSGNVLINATTETGTASQPLQVTGGAYISGNLGVGTATPGWKLDVYNASDSIIRSRASGNTSAGFLASTDNGTNNWFFGSRKDSTGGTAGTDRFNLLYNANSLLAVDTSGNFGLGVTPSVSYGKEFSISTDLTSGVGGLGVRNLAANNHLVYLANNAKNTGAFTDAFWTSAPASKYAQNQGVHYWYTASSGTAGATISFNQAMTLDVNGNLGINTTTINTKLTVVGIQTTDAVNVSTLGPAVISNSANNVDTTALRTVLSLQRFGKSGSSYNSQVNFNIGRYSQSGTGGNTQLTLRLANGNTNDPDTDVMSLWANGNVGIGTINPGDNRLRVNKDLGTNDYISVAQHNSQFQIGRVSDNKSLEFAVLDNGTSVIQSKEVSVGYNNLAIQPSANVLINSLTATGTASQALQVNSGAYFNGNVAIGITNPTSTLHVVGSFYNSISVNSTTTIFEHTGANAPVPFSISKSGFTGTSKDYGILYLDLANNTVGNGSNLHFTLRNSANGLTEYAGLGGIINSNTAGSYSGSLVFYTSNSGVNRNERARIDNLGNFGVNTISPLQRLDVRGNFLLAADGTTATHITQKPYTINNGTLSWEGSAGQLFSITNNLTSGSIFSVNDVSGIPSIDVNADGTVLIAPYTGNVGVGLLTPTSKLHVSGNITATGQLQSTTGVRTLEQVRATGWFGTSTGSSYTGLGVEMGMSGGQGYVLCYNRDSNSWGTMNIQGNNGSTNIQLPASGSTINVTGNISVSGNITATQFTSLSDVNKKKNIRPIENAIDITKKLEGVRFEWKDTDAPSIGVIAQQVEKVIPELVVENDGVKSVSYGNIIGVLIEAIKEQQNQIEELKTEITALKNK